MKKIKMKMNNLEDNGEYIGAPGAITGTDLSKYYDQNGKFDGQSAIQSGEKIMDVLEALFNQPFSYLVSDYKQHILKGGCSVYSKPNSVNKDFTGGHLNALYYDDRIYARRIPGPGLYEYLDMDLDYSKPLSVNNPYNIKLNSSFGVELTKDEFEAYSKLSNVNINNGQDSTFSFNSCKSKSAPIVEQAVNNRTYRPLPGCLTVRESNIEGLGVFATEDIYLLDTRDPNVWKTHTLLVYNDWCDNKVEELLRSGLGAYINHSNNPNCTLGKISSYAADEIVVEKYFLRPLVDIESGSELTLDYRVELCGLTGYEGAEFLKEESNEVINTNLLDEEDYINYKSDKIEDRVYRSAYGDMYEYNPSFGKFQLVGVSRNNGRIFYSASDAEIFLNRIK